MKISGVNNNGHEYVDLGLPSGTLWATMNIGANSVTDNGLYFAWGETTGYTAAQVGSSQGKKHFSWIDYELGNGDSTADDMTKYNSTDSKTVLEAVDDAAVVNMGGEWHMPTKAQFDELLNTTYVTNAWVTNYQGSGVNGRLFTSVADNTKTLFFPAAGSCYNGSVDNVGRYGYVWSRSVYESYLNSARVMYFYSGGVGVSSYDSRCFGYSVRGVINASESPKYATKEELNAKQDVIDSSHKLSADLITDGTTNKVINVKPDWNAASDSDAEILNKPTNVSSFTNDSKYVTEDDMQVTTMDANGHEYVDLGLPSGTLWATMNVGATKPEEYGLYFAWGDTQGYADASTKAFSWADYKWSDKGSSSVMTKYNATDGKTVLDAEDDAAAVNWGGNWKMPTKEQWDELFNTANCTNAWTTVNGVNGRLFTGKNGNTLFIPAAGSCNGGSVYGVGSSGDVWASSLRSSSVSSAWSVDFYSNRRGVNDYDRCSGRSVRGVIKSSKAPKYATKAELADVATSGSYNDLSDKPTIGAFVIETTYAELVATKNGGTLAKGAWYRITDYITTTAQSNTQSAGHAFDVIVRADSESVLNENAFAIQHDGDTYFANQKLSAWELKYDINNDTTKYAWADETNGKGVIYYMKDENDNECPYDFKNIQFKVGAKQQAGTVVNVFYFTFSVATGENDATVTDHSLNGGKCYNNKVGVNMSSNKRKLNANVFRNTSATSDCRNNTFGNNCNNNTFGNSCGSNTFGNNCNNNTFGNSCGSNTFGNGCGYNIFGDSCNYNTFGNGCGSNTFGNGCRDNKFRSNCNNNTFGNNCSSNIFGDSCEENKFGTASATKDYYQNIIFENNVQFVLLDCTQTTSDSARCQNVLVGMGIRGEDENEKTLTVATAGNAFKTTFKTANDVEIDA